MCGRYAFRSRSTTACIRTTCVGSGDVLRSRRRLWRRSSRSGSRTAIGCVLRSYMRCIHSYWSPRSTRPTAHSEPRSSSSTSTTASRSGDGAISISSWETWIAHVRLQRFRPCTPLNILCVVPWDLVNNYDVFVAGAPTGNPKMQLFMPGHMTVFRRSPEVAREFLKLEEVSSYDKFMNMEWIIRPKSDGCGTHLAPFPAPSLTMLQRRANTRTRCSCSPT